MRKAQRDGSVLYFDYDEAGRRTDQCFGPPGLTGDAVCQRPEAGVYHLRWTYIDDDPRLVGLLRSVEWVVPSPGTSTSSLADTGTETGIAPGAVRYDYTALGQIASLETLDLTNLLLFSERYAYDDDGRVIEVESASDLLSGGLLAGGPSPLGIRRYAYQLDRLASEEDTRGGAAPGVTEFAFDAAGNLTTRGEQSQHYDADNQLTAIDDPTGVRPASAFAWNANGNQLSDDRGQRSSPSPSRHQRADVGELRTENPSQEFNGLRGFGGRWVTIRPQG